MLAPSLVNRLADLFQDSEHVRNLGLEQTPDTDVWRQAKNLGYVIVTKDKDFANLSLVWGAPPHAEPPGRSETVMTKLVRKTLTDSPMTPARKRRLAGLAKRPDSEIDFSD